MKSNFKNISAALLAGLSLALTVSSCKKDDSSNNDPGNKVISRTGLSGTDDVNTIPKNINKTSSLFGTTTLPARVDLTQYLPPIGDQGQFGTCVAWATAYNCKSALEAVKFGLTSTQLATTAHQLSPKDLFFNVDDDKKGASDCGGTDFVPALDVVLNRGVATMAVAPYTGMGNCAKANADAAWNADAAKHKIDRYRRLDFTASAVKTELAAKNPVILGAKLADNFMSWNTDQVYQNHSAFDQVGIHSYHAMCIVGYDDSKGPNGAFKVVNSWSNSWGAAGYIWVDYNFMFNGFCFNNNLFVASNDNQKPEPGPGPNPNPEPQPTPAGVDLVPWVYSDDSDPVAGYPTRRYMNYDVFNIGTQTAGTSNQWAYAYIYYNAYDANDYGLVFYNKQDPSQPANGATFNCNDNSCLLNVAIPSDNSIAGALNGPYLYQYYAMPSSLNGEYYLVMVADVTNKFAEQDEDNNIFYVTDQYPVEFNNGVGGRRGTQAPLVYKNQLKGGIAAVKSPAAKRSFTARNAAHPNAYSPAEIISMLQDRAASGELAQKIQAYRKGQPDVYQSGVAAQ